jgi:large subunit ribosomal protein L29
MKIAEIRGKTDSELDYELEKMQKELFDMRFRSAAESLSNTARIDGLRRTIARVKTVLHERAAGVRGQESR